MVEKSTIDGSTFLSTWDRLDHAAEYHDSQEHPEDWQVAAVYDLDTGHILEAETTTRFVPQRVVPPAGDRG